MWVGMKLIGMLLWEKTLDVWGWGVVIRDSQGTMQAARCVMRMGYLAPLVAEAMAVLVSIQLCHELGITKVHFEGDAKGVVDMVNSSDVDISWMEHVIADIKMEIQEFEGWQDHVCLEGR
jgi:ribonuclease HI